MCRPGRRAQSAGIIWPASGSPQGVFGPAGGRGQRPALSAPLSAPRSQRPALSAPLSASGGGFPVAGDDEVDDGRMDPDRGCDDVGADVVQTAKEQPRCQQI